MVLLDKDKTTDFDEKVQTVSNTAGTCCFSIRLSPGNYAKDKQVVQTKHTLFITQSVPVFSFLSPMATFLFHPNFFFFWKRHAEMSE